MKKWRFLVAQPKCLDATMPKAGATPRISGVLTYPSLLPYFGWDGMCVSNHKEFW